MTTNSITLRYETTRFEGIEMGGQIWLRGGQIDAPLGFADERQVRKLFTRHEDEFGSDEAQRITLPSAGGSQQTLLFSLRGCRLLAIFARTPQAAAFRRWVLDVLEGKVALRQPSLDLPVPPLGTEALRLLDQLEQAVDAGHPAQDMIRSLRDGSTTLPADPQMDRLVNRLEGARALHGEASRSYREVARMAQQAGYTLEAVKREARRARASHG